MGGIEHLMTDLEPIIREYGPAAILVVIALEALGAPAPGETLLVFAAALAARGELSAPWLFLAAWCGAVIGDNIGFAIGHYAGRALILRFGARIGLGADRLGKVESIYRTYGPATAALARFVALLRQLNGPVAGMLNMDWRRFALFEALGAGAWALAWLLFGYYVGEHSALVIGIVRKFWPAALVLAGLAAAGLLVWHAHMRRGSG
jgi:membrane protein DedA with SNARE-associated domain